MVPPKKQCMFLQSKAAQRESHHVPVDYLCMSRGHAAIVLPTPAACVAGRKGSKKTRGSDAYVFYCLDRAATPQVQITPECQKRPSIS